MFGKRCVRFFAFVPAAYLALVFLSPQNSRAQSGSFFGGSVPTGQATATPLQLSLRDVFDRALKYNLGGIESTQDARAAHAVRLRNLNPLLPNVSGRLSYALEQVDLRANGLNLRIPGVTIPKAVGPFAVEDARGYVSQEIFNWSHIQGFKAAGQAEQASQLKVRSDRDQVILVTGDAYLLVISDLATVEVTQAQLKTAQTLYDQDFDRGKQGVIAHIDVLRSEVELQTEQQRLIAAQNQLSIDKLSLARVIGLPNGQEFDLSDSVPYVPLAEKTLDDALQEARANRPDYLSAKAQVRAAELARSSAAAENYPSVSTDTNYGDIGSPNFGTSHGTLSFAVGLNVPIFQGTRARADELQADADLAKRRAELSDLDGKIDAEVRTAFYNLKSSSDLVAVAKRNIDLANETLAQAQDRFSAGVADNLEVVQAQESVASANQSYIASLYSYNVAKISLAQTLGAAEKTALHYLLGGE